MQAEKSVEIESGIGPPAFRLRDRDRGTQTVIVRFGKRDNHIETIHRAALKQHDHFLLVRRSRGSHGALQERWQRRHTQHRNPAALQKISS